jgi:hypothetical protein
VGDVPIGRLEIEGGSEMVAMQIERGDRGRVGARDPDHQLERQLLGALNTPPGGSGPRAAIAGYTG